MTVLLVQGLSLEIFSLLGQNHFLTFIILSQGI